MANKNTVQEAFPVLGMSCASCAARIDKTLNHQPVSYTHLTLPTTSRV